MATKTLNRRVEYRLVFAYVSLTKREQQGKGNNRGQTTVLICFVKPWSVPYCSIQICWRITCAYAGSMSGKIRISLSSLCRALGKLTWNRGAARFCAVHLECRVRCRYFTIAHCFLTALLMIDFITCPLNQLAVNTPIPMAVIPI